MTEPMPDRDAARGDTAHPEIDATLAALAEVADAPPAEQVGPLTDAHRVLSETLDSIGPV